MLRLFLVINIFELIYLSHYMNINRGRFTAPMLYSVLKNLSILEHGGRFRKSGKFGQVANQVPLAKEGVGEKSIHYHFLFAQIALTDL